MEKSELKDLYLDELDKDMWEEETLPFRRLMSYYSCAVMEIETKLRVLNEEFSLGYDKNPIESIESRIKSKDGIIKKLKRRGLPVTLESIEEHIWDIADKSKRNQETNHPFHWTGPLRTPRRLPVLCGPDCGFVF